MIDVNLTNPNEIISNREHLILSSLEMNDFMKWRSNDMDLNIYLSTLKQN
jgi:hypothetical protein